MMKKRILSLFLAISVLSTLLSASSITVSAAASLQNGVCGDGVSWEYSYDIAEEYHGKLTITGNGKITDYKRFHDTPWYAEPYSDNYGINSLVVNYGVTAIGDYAFWGKELNAHISLPDSITRVGKGAFGKSDVQSIKLSRCLAEIGEYAFGSTELKSIEIADSVQRIGKGAFWNSQIGSVSFGKNLKYIDDDAFAKCYNLDHELTLPAGLTRIGIRAFKDDKLSGELRIPDSVTEIGEGAFSGNGINELVLGKGIKRIEDHAFADCSSLNKVTVSSGVTHIGTGAFQNCSSLDVLVIPATVTCVEKNAFKDCPDDTRIYYTGTKEQWNKINRSIGNDMLSAAIIQFDSFVLISPDYSKISNSSKYEISSHLIESKPNGTLSIMLDTGSFSCISDGGVTIDTNPATVITARDANQYFTISDGSKLSFTTIRNGTITLSYQYTFSDDVSGTVQRTTDKQITVDGRGGNGSGGGGGSGGSSGSSVVTGFPDSPDGTGLLDYTVEYDSWNAERFLVEEAWNRIASITISSEVESISPYAFSYLENLKTITIPTSVTTIGFGAFEHTKALTDVYYKGTSDDWNEIEICANNSYLSAAKIHFVEAEISDIRISETDSVWYFDVIATHIPENANVYAAIYNKSGILITSGIAAFDSKNEAAYLRVNKVNGASYARIMIWSDDFQPVTLPSEKIPL